MIKAHSLSMNPTLWLLLVSDFLTETGFGLILPILGIFIIENISDGSIFVVGIADAIFLVTKSIIQLPLARYVDKHNSLSKPFLIFGSFLITLAPLLYLFANNAYWIYFAQLIYAIGSGFSYPSWLILWTENLDKNKKSFEWSLYSTMVGLGTAGSAAIGASIAQVFGFQVTFIVVSVLSALGSIMLFTLRGRSANHIKYIDAHSILPSTYRRG